MFRQVRRIQSSSCTIRREFRQQSNPGSNMNFAQPKPINEMLKGNPPSDANFKNKEINNLIKMGGIQEAMTMADQMIKQGIAPKNEQDYLTLITLYARSQKVDRVQKLCEKMKEDKVKPNIAIYNTLIKFYNLQGQESASTRARMVYRAELVFKELKETGWWPSIVTYNNMISLYANNDKPAEAQSIYEEMRHNSWNPIRPDEMTFETLITMYSRSNNRVSAGKIFQEMKDLNERPSEFLYNLMIGMYAKNESPEAQDSAFKLYLEMKELNIRMSETTYTQLIKGLTRVKESWCEAEPEMTEAEKFEIEIKNKKEKAPRNSKQDQTEVKVEAIIEPKEKEALMIYNEMRNNNVRRDINVYHMLIHMFSRLSKPLEAYVLFEEMKNEGMMPDRRTFDIMIKMYVSLNQPREALKLFSDMNKANIEMDISFYKYLITAHLQLDDLDEALSILEEMKTSKSGKSHRSMYTSISDLILAHLNGLIVKYSELDNKAEAVNSFKKIKQFGFKPSMESYNSIIALYCNLKLAKDAIALIGEMKKEEVVPELSMYTKIIKMLAQVEVENEKNSIDTSSFRASAQKSNPALSFFNEMKEQELHPDLSTYNSMIEMYTKLERYLDSFEPFNHALSLFNEMKEENPEVIPDSFTFNCLFSCFWIRENRNHVAHAYRKKETDDAHGLVTCMREAEVTLDYELIRELTEDDHFSNEKINQYFQKLDPLNKSPQERAAIEKEKREKEERNRAALEKQERENEADLIAQEEMLRNKLDAFEKLETENRDRLIRNEEAKEKANQAKLDFLRAEAAKSAKERAEREKRMAARVEREKLEQERPTREQYQKTQERDKRYGKSKFERE